MKNLKLIIALFLATALIFSCKDKEGKKQGDVVVTPTPTKKELSEVLTASEIQSLTASIGSNEAARGKPVKLPQTVTVVAASMTLSNNGGGSFGINYGGATNIIWMFFRGGDSLSTVSGNVYPTASQSFYQNPVTTFTANFTKTYYQSVVTTGSMERDANGVLGADWVFTYTNVVQ
jgi:hypothetical protein